MNAPIPIKNILQKILTGLEVPDLDFGAGLEVALAIEVYYPDSYSKYCTQKLKVKSENLKVLTVNF